MSQILDIYSDKSLRGLVHALRENPEFHTKELLKTAVDYSDQETMPDRAFAWPEKRRYPIQNKKMAKLSALYRSQFPPEHKGIEVPKSVDSMIEKAAFLYDFEVPKIREKKAVKVASIKEDDYLLPKIKRFPVRDKEEGMFIQGIIKKNAHVMAYSNLAEASNNLITKMASFDTDYSDIDPIIYKYAGLTLSNKDTLEAGINRRLDFVKPEFKQHYIKLAEIMDDMDFNRINLVKIASTLEEIDKIADMKRLYDKHLPNPMETVFNTNTIYTAKVASEDVFTPEMADGVTECQVRSILGDDVADEATGTDGLDKEMLVSVVNSLPKDMVSDFVDRI